MGSVSPTISPTVNRQNATLSHGSKPAQSSALESPAIGISNPNNLSIKILKNTQDMIEFESAWRKLEKQVAKPSNVFQSYDWCLSWVRTCTPDNDCYDVHIVTVSNGDQCLLIWPMMTMCSGPFHILRWLSEPYSQYGDVLARDDKNLNPCLELAWQQLNDHPYADSIRLRHVREDATVAKFINQHARPGSHIDYAPFLEIAKFPTEAAYDNRYTKTQRRRRKRIHKALEQFGSLDFSTASKGKKFLHTLKNAITGKRTWLAERGLYSKPLISDELEPFFIDLSKTAKTLATTASQLNAGDREVSYEIALRYQNHHFAYITAHDARLTDISPGRLHMDMSQRAALRNGLNTFDLMVPAAPHKKTWSNNSVQTRDYFIHLNARGAIYTKTYLEFLLPMIRKIYHSAPASVRRKIMRFIP